MQLNTPWSALVWDDGDCWRWDVRGAGLRSTGQRPTWDEAWEAARAEMATLRSGGEG
jgi:hypothetical protein